MPPLLTAADITRLTQTMTDEPLGRLATFEKTVARFRRLLSERIGKDRADAMAPLLLQGADYAAARDRLKSELDLLANPEPPAPATEPPRDPSRRAKRAASTTAHHEAAQRGILPEPPDFTAPTHARFRKKLAEVSALAARGDIDALRAFKINPVSSSPKALARYRDLCVVALSARKEA